MGARKRSSVERYHDRVAHRYDDSYRDDYWRWHDALTWDYLRPHLPGSLDAPIVDLGCGTGKWSARFVESGYTVTCVDISQRMLDRAAHKLQTGSGRSRVSFVRADLMDLSDLPAAAFAMAVGMGDPICCTASPVRAMRQIRRILRPDGLLCATLDNRLAAIDYYLEQGDPETLRRFLREGRTHWLTRDKKEQFPITTFLPSDVSKFVESAGFELIDLVGKTVLPMRAHREKLAESADRRTWASIEKKLSRRTDAMGRASHLQFVCRVRSK